jgi:Ca2+-binding EF-hand superfamily protein
MNGVAIAGFAFDIFDTDDSNNMSKEEVESMINEIYKTVVGNKQAVVGNLLSRIELDHDNCISRSNFIKSCNNFPQILFPALHMQVLILLI